MSKCQGKNQTRGKQLYSSVNRSVTEATKQIIKGILGVCEIQHYEKYLGLPSFIGKGKKASFNYIKDKV